MVRRARVYRVRVQPSTQTGQGQASGGGVLSSQQGGPGAVSAVPPAPAPVASPVISVGRIVAIGSGLYRVDCSDPSGRSFNVIVPLSGLTFTGVKLAATAAQLLIESGQVEP
jgi:hypothetical protein